MTGTCSRLACCRRRAGAEQTGQAQSRQAQSGQAQSRQAPSRQAPSRQAQSRRRAGAEQARSRSTEGAQQGRVRGTSNARAAGHLGRDRGAHRGRGLGRLEGPALPPPARRPAHRARMREHSARLPSLGPGSANLSCQDGRDTMASEVKFPSRPILCRRAPRPLSGGCRNGVAQRRTIGTIGRRRLLAQVARGRMLGRRAGSARTRARSVVCVCVRVVGCMLRVRASSHVETGGGQALWFGRVWG